MYCSFPSLKDPLFDAGPELRHTGEVVTFVPWETFEPWMSTRWQKRGDDYAAFKEKGGEIYVPSAEEKAQFVDMVKPLRKWFTDKYGPEWLDLLQKSIAKAEAEIKAEDAAVLK